MSYRADLEGGEAARYLIFVHSYSTGFTAIFYLSLLRQQDRGGK